MQSERTEMPTQDPVLRRHNFSEVALGYNAEMAAREAHRCLHCKVPQCVTGCPVNVRIPEFIAAIAAGNVDEAGAIIRSTNSLPAICGRVCPQERQCESKCVLGKRGESVAIGRLERYAADNGKKEKITPVPSNGKRVAIIGSGPAGLACAGDLAQKGYRVTVFEAFHRLGGVLVYGIPEFRLPKAIVQQEVDGLRDMGVEFVTNVVVGKTFTVDELFSDGYRAVFIASGAGLPRFMGIPGENLMEVYTANEFLTRLNLMKAYQEGSKTPIAVGKRVAVVGGGNVAMDSARWAARLGTDEVHIVYRRSMNEMPARKEEVLHAREEGIIFDELVNPVEILGEDFHVTGLKCVRMELGEPDASGRRKPVEVPGSEFVMPVDTVIMAIGTKPNKLISITTEGLETDQRGCIVADEETMRTSREGVYAGGDAVTGAATVILAMGAGKKAAASIDEYLQSK